MARRPVDPEEIERIEVRPEDVLYPGRRFERTTTQLERSFGPSCLLSLIIVFLLLVILRRYLQLPWAMLLLLVAAVWFGVLILLVRWRPDVIVEEEE